MGDVKKIINALTDIGKATYQKVHDGKPPSSRKTGHQLAFESLQGSAGQVAAILKQNPKPGRDQRENIGSQFAAMDKNLKVYATKTTSRDVILAFNRASTEWMVLVNELSMSASG